MPVPPGRIRYIRPLRRRCGPGTHPGLRTRPLGKGEPTLTRLCQITYPARHSGLGRLLDIDPLPFDHEEKSIMPLAGPRARPQDPRSTGTRRRKNQNGVRADENKPCYCYNGVVTSPSYYVHNNTPCMHPSASSTIPLRCQLPSASAAPPPRIPRELENADAVCSSRRL